MLRSAGGAGYAVKRRTACRSAAQRAVIRGIFAMPAAQQTSSRLNMQPPGLNVYASQSST